MSIERIELNNFTVFKNIKINFSKGINVLIGENGTGKTQLLNAIYGDIQIDKSKNVDDILKYFKSVVSNDECSYEISYSTKVNNCTFIPAKDMLTHSKGLVSMADKFGEFPFDKILIDIWNWCKSNEWGMTA